MPRRPLTVLSLKNIPFESIFETMFTDTGFVCFQPKEGQAAGRFSIIASSPENSFSMAGGFINIDGHTTIDTPVEAFKRFCEEIDSIDIDPYLPFSGGAVGYIGFEGAKAFRGCSPAKGFSRVPQCRFGIYRTFVIFDHVENISYVATHQTSKSEMIGVYDFIDRLKTGARTNFVFTEHDTKSQYNDIGRMIPNDATFSELAKAAHLWLRADRLKRIHLMRHEEKPQVGLTPQKLFLSNHPNESRFIFSHEGVSSIFASDDLLLKISDDEVFSNTSISDNALMNERKDELKSICSDDCMKFSSSKNGFTIRGKIHPGVNHIDGLANLLPSSSLTGFPKSLALSYIDENEREHRSFYGGAFGTVQSNGLEFRTIERVTTFADGTIRETSGADLNADQNPDTFLEKF
ncbi:MAG: hypothetical protein HN337_00305 [Deltaproteobacteria bacterium]|jgi:anthranilate/para-aminobenzoate synthase component I|nr:hypothetical protein [Deltaproteobacteria bacterium]